MTAALLAGCGGHKAAAPPPTSTTVPATTTTKPKPKPKPPQTAPLTGLFQPNKAQLRAPAVVIKIDNVDAARPQTSIDQADVVYEELVEGGLTRLAAVFQSKYPTTVGPVRSGRLTDTGIADDLNSPVFAYSGTNAVFLPILRSQPLTDADDGNRPGFFWRVPFAASPHNLYTNAAALATTSSTHTPPHPLFLYHAPHAAFTGAGIQPAAVVNIGFPAAFVGWNYNGKTALWNRSQNRTPDTVRNGPQLAASNVVIEFIPYSTSLMATGEGGPPSPIPAGNLVGTGLAWYFSAGHVVKGTWSRPNLTTVTTFKDAKGAPVRLTAGKTWVELVPWGITPLVVP
jgi:hypothetical protein